MVAGRARAVVVGIGSSTAMGSIRDSMLKTEDVRNMNTLERGGVSIYLNFIIIHTNFDAGSDTTEKETR